ncbi:putative YbaK/aminoacyl-tRNA synthetase-associated domain [Vibrio nigripulchritudo SFn27]|uniref:Putative YbaK/aminoacyl-tRNA synthetase-associated domain n=1 Tax=Vibrio nigripulchritudo TaxID=28173 RepID=U4KC81_9VIBR|nr:YbaK/EbsC family protein [Vibrio nigripulchritudo]CCN83864.1 putative YbaK/aminoacyl-tRNA synthetase-associated domain [Vibrio nigripulchritudo BLFn1]CCN91113.1 putative YbaK/aminoacyl-tRNA synthetase-associated domain [Vibrio nigripulchritudo SFn27]CCN92684.1 putative YbaK/aminoacyl-tRNA synthetase-associated domain [Vibrio nigripulchritudo ENn2]CCO43882.1 putative YbaK/aminoacyl-tRNA synthetase-associated domain [Vibrio nigripulchritudo SFn135]CCO55548.1 putative YbaK/aminoacyl-tRNA synth
MTNNFHTQVTEYLDRQQVSFRLLPHQTPAVSIEDAAQQRGIDPRIMVKCILLKDMGGQFALACVPGDKQADPKKVRAILSSRRMTCASAPEIESLTGYSLGCVTPLLLTTPMPIIFDRQITSLTRVTISSGSNMAGIELLTSDLLSLLSPTFAEITR